MGNDSGFQVGGDAAQNYERFIGTFMIPWAENLVAAADIERGERVLDVACGTGFVARTAAAAGATVIGADVNALMLDVARTIGTFEVVEASAEDIGVDADSFDVVVCQQGLQYFPDTGAALAESVRCLRSGGRAFFSVWAPLDDNPFFKGQADALEPFIGPEVAESIRSTGVAALGGADAMVEHLSAAGFTDVNAETERLQIDIPPISEYLPNMLSATPWASAFAELTDGQRQTVTDHMEGIIAAREDPDGSILDMSSVIVSGVA